MRKIKTAFTSILTALFSFLAVNCQDLNETGNETSPFFSSEADELDLAASVKYIVVRNSAGFTSVSGGNPPDLVNIAIYKTIWAASENDAMNHFGDIFYENSVSSDSLLIDVSSFSGSSSRQYKAELEVKIPSSNAVFIKAPNEGAKIQNMAAFVTVSGSTGPVTLLKQNGSCDLTTLKGNITADFSYLKDGSICRCKTGSGDIVVTVPSGFSGVLTVKTLKGKVSYSGLSIKNLNQTDQQLSGTVGTGSGEMTLLTDSGNISVTGY